MKDVYYIRHIANWGNYQDKSVITHLKENKLIAIHFDGIDSWDSSKYEEKFGSTAIEYLNKFNENDDLIIVASYQDQENIIIGKPKLNSKFFYRDRFSDENLPYLKVLEIEPIKEIKINDFPQAFILAPQQGTLVQWHQGKISVNAFLNLIEYDTTNPNFYLPYQLEILAEEWLRRNKLLKSKLFNTGGYLKDLDSFGLDWNNKPVIVQVKFRANEKEFDNFKSLTEKFNECSCYFFSTNNAPERFSKNFKHISIQEVLNFFKDDSYYLEKLIKP